MSGGEKTFHVVKKLCGGEKNCIVVKKPFQVVRNTVWW